MNEILIIIELPGLYSCHHMMLRKMIKALALSLYQISHNLLPKNRIFGLFEFCNQWVPSA